MSESTARPPAVLTKASCPCFPQRRWSWSPRGGLSSESSEKSPSESLQAEARQYPPDLLKGHHEEAARQHGALGHGSTTRGAGLSEALCAVGHLARGSRLGPGSLSAEVSADLADLLVRVPAEGFQQTAESSQLHLRRPAVPQSPAHSCPKRLRPLCRGPGPRLPGERACTGVLRRG